MKTSNFARNGGHPHAVSIAGKSPDWYQGQEFKALAPPYWVFKRYKEDGDEWAYEEDYRKEVLDELDPQEIYEELGDDAILLCYESPGQFCHRRLVAQWLEENLDITIEEI